jgi:hypothetical protein
MLQCETSSCVRNWGSHSLLSIESRGICLGVKRPGREVKHSPPSLHLLPRLRMGGATHLLPLCAFVARTGGNFTFIVQWCTKEVVGLKTANDMRLAYCGYDQNFCCFAKDLSVRSNSVWSTSDPCGVSLSLCWVPPGHCRILRILFPFISHRALSAVLSRLLSEWYVHSFCSLSYDRSVASSKASSPQGAI